MIKLVNVLLVLSQVIACMAPYNETRIFQTADHVYYEIEDAPECVNSQGDEAEECIKHRSGLSHDHLIEHDDFDKYCCYLWVKLDCHEMIAKDDYNRWRRLVDIIQTDEENKKCYDWPYEPNTYSTCGSTSLLPGLVLCLSMLTCIYQ